MNCNSGCHNVGVINIFAIAFCLSQVKSYWKLLLILVCQIHNCMLFTCSIQPGSSHPAPSKIKFEIKKRFSVRSKGFVISKKLDCFLNMSKKYMMTTLRLIMTHNIEYVHKAKL